MKSFKQFLYEVEANEQDKQVLTDALRTINSDCQQFLHQMASGGKFYPLFIGSTVSHWPDIEVKARAQESPFAQDAKLNACLSRVLSERYGALYKNSTVIATGDPKIAATYGEKHMIFPIGRYDYVWSLDSQNIFTDLSTSNDGAFDIAFAKTQSPEEEDTLVNSYFDKNNFMQNQYIKRCSDTGHEVIIACSYYYAIPTKIVLQNYDMFKESFGEFHFSKNMKTDLS